MHEAPNVDPENGHLDEDAEQRLFAHDAGGEQVRDGRAGPAEWIAAVGGDEDEGSRRRPYAVGEQPDGTGNGTVSPEFRGPAPRSPAPRSRAPGEPRAQQAGWLQRVRLGKEQVPDQGALSASVRRTAPGPRASGGTGERGRPHTAYATDSAARQREELGMSTAAGGPSGRREAGAPATRGEAADERWDDARGERTDRTRAMPVGRSERAVREDAVLEQREAFGGVKVGSAFFGWLTATGMAVLLTALVAAAGTAVGVATRTNVDQAANDATKNPQSVGLVGGIVLLVVLFVSYYCGGYVAGRMARFNGTKQGLAVWLWAVVIAVVVAAVAAVAGSKYDVLSRLDSFPRIPVDGGTLTSGGIIALVVVALASLLGALIGGRAGMHFHRKVDRAVLDA